MYQQPKIEEKIQLRVVVISVLVIAMILGLVAAIVVIATTKTDVSEENIESTALVDNGASEVNNATAVTEQAEGVKEENKSTDNDSPYASTKKTENTTTTTTNKVKDLPKTGPEELLPLALIGGALAAYGASALKTRRK